jgi:hypothetical protein
MLRKGQTASHPLSLIQAKQRNKNPLYSQDRQGFCFPDIPTLVTVNIKINIYFSVPTHDPYQFLTTNKAYCKRFKRYIFIE